MQVLRKGVQGIGSVGIRLHKQIHTPIRDATDTVGEGDADIRRKQGDEGGRQYGMDHPGQICSETDGIPQPRARPHVLCGREGHEEGA